jgi:subtilisin-like proprotein convertase family protein
MTLTIRIATLCLTIIAAVGSSTAWACAYEFLVLTTQAQVDAVGARGCENNIRGTLKLQGSNITNLDALSGITSVGGDLTIGFDDGGALPGGSTTALTNLDGLSGITSVGRNLEISINTALTNLDGLSGITSVVGSLTISGNPALTNLDGLSGITGVVGDLKIGGNTLLTNLAGLSGITGVEGLSIGGDRLTNLDGLSGITSVGGGLIIGGNRLTNIDGLSGITSVGGDLQIVSTLLTNLAGLSGITSVGGSLTIGSPFGSSNPALTNLDALSGITSVGGDLTISRNLNLADCVGIAELLGWPSGPPDDSVGGGIYLGVVAGFNQRYPNASGCNSVEEILASVTAPSQPVITQVSTGNGYAALTFTPSTQTEALFPITGYEAACLGSPAENATSPALNVLDNSDAVKSSLIISGYPAVATPGEIEVDVNISHARPLHLRIQLTSPQGTILTLWDKSAQTATDIVGTFPTTLTSLDSIDSVASEDMNGTWVLSVQDVNAIGGYEGVLNSWGMRIKENAKATGSNSPITISGLANNRDYACTVVPVTKLGVLPTSAAVTATPRPDLPATPVITSVTEDDSGLVVSFILASDGGAPITDYTATCGGISASSNSSPIIVEGLTNGQQYSCTVVATNSVGSSSASAAASGTPEEFTGSGLPIWLLHEATKGNHPLVN